MTVRCGLRREVEIRGGGVQSNAKSVWAQERQQIDKHVHEETGTLGRKGETSRNRRFGPVRQDGSRGCAATPPWREVPGASPESRAGP